MEEGLRGYREVDPYQWQTEPFKLIGKDWFEVVTYNGEGNPNAMTAAWGGLGVFWNLPVAYVVIRGEEYRYSRKLIDRYPMFSLCFLDDDQAAAKAYLGKAHGWDDPDKIANAGLQLGWFCGAKATHDPTLDEEQCKQHIPFIDGSRVVMMCEKICVQQLPEECYIDPDIWAKHYTTQDEHCLYIAEVKHLFVREDG